MSDSKPLSETWHDVRFCNPEYVRAKLACIDTGDIRERIEFLTADGRTIHNHPTGNELGRLRAELIRRAAMPAQDAQERALRAKIGVQRQPQIEAEEWLARHNAEQAAGWQSAMEELNAGFADSLLARAESVQADTDAGLVSEDADETPRPYHGHFAPQDAIREGLKERAEGIKAHANAVLDQNVEAARQALEGNPFYETPPERFAYLKGAATDILPDPDNWQFVQGESKKYRVDHTGGRGPYPKPQAPKMQRAAGEPPEAQTGHVGAAAASPEDRDAPRVFMDGNAFCAVGPDFVNLQESPAGFGDTREEAIAELAKAAAPTVKPTPSAWETLGYENQRARIAMDVRKARDAMVKADDAATRARGGAKLAANAYSRLQIEAAVHEARGIATKEREE